jgi:hypothetical protein
MIVGRVDGMRNGKVYGWAFNSDEPDEHLEIKVSRGGVVIATSLANILRKDLPDAGIGNGDHAFDIALSPDTSSFHGVMVMAHSTKAGEALLSNATNDDRRMDDLFQIFSRRYDEALVAFKAEIDGLKKADSHPRIPKSELPPDLGRRLSQLEKRMDDIEVFVVRLDEIAKGLQQRIDGSRSRGIFSSLLQKRS